MGNREPTGRGPGEHEADATRTGQAGKERDPAVCSNCGTVLIEYEGNRVVERRIKDGRCPACGSTVAVV